ncbi:hypothetical protein [Pseudochrobactrum sp. MP213Fo]|uniref:hypothetical protein n=1 Tax=Pseudochrobactrum sp. MP213Fo TaxID=3022250 RepID=UPI003BA23993
MAIKPYRSSNKAFSPSPGHQMGENDPARTDAAIRSIARLIGRQIAREQFERKAQKQQHVKPLPSP